MACDISLGRTEQCKDSVGGLKAVYFMNWGDATGFTFDVDGLVTDVAGTPSAYRYELKGTSTFEQTVTSSRENGTTFVEQKLSLSLKKLSNADNKQLKLLSYGRPQIWVEDNNGNIVLAGRTKGMDLTTAAISNGAAMGDFSGYKLEFQGMEQESADYLDANDLVTAGVTIVVGV